MNKQYYYLISSLPALRLDDYKEPYRVTDFVNELREHLTAVHCRYVQEILCRYDNSHIVDVLTGNDIPWNPQGGNWPFDTMRESLRKQEDGFVPFDGVNVVCGAHDYPLAQVSDYIIAFLKEFRSREKEQEAIVRQEIEDDLLARYYKKMINHENRFIREYFAFDLQLRNILVALNRRKFKLEMEGFIMLGNTAFDEKLLTSAAGDFGLAKDVDYIQGLVDSFYNNEIVHTEKYIDQLRWQKVGEINTFVYFEIDVLLGYLIKLMLVERWINLDEHRGQEVFAKRTEVNLSTKN